MRKEHRCSRPCLTGGLRGSDSPLDRMGESGNWRSTEARGLTGGVPPGAMQPGKREGDALTQPREAAMSTTEDRSSDASVGNVDMKLEVVTLPVKDLDRAKAFYAGLGWRLDADFVLGGVRAIQFTPPGSGCSIHFSPGTAAVPPGSAQGLFLIVSDIEAARDDLTRRGVKVGEIFHNT